MAKGKKKQQTPDVSDEELNEEKADSKFLTECKNAFNETDFYIILNLDKNKASSSEIKKAYYKLSLRYHPDKVTDDTLKEESKLKFQCLGKIYSILSDDEKRKLYDETGLIDGEDDMFSGDQADWDDYFRSLFKKVTKNDIDSFFKGYKESKEEREDLIRIYEKCKGNMDDIMIEMISDDMVDNEVRFREIIQDAIDKKETKKLDLFVNESKKKAAKRKSHYEKEAKEAEELKKQIGIDESQDSLRNMILARRKDASANFLDNLAAKYSKLDKGKTKVFKGTKGKKAKSFIKSDSEEENEPLDSDESLMTESESEESDIEVKPKRKSAVIKNKSVGKRKSTTAPVKRKVKRL